MAYLSGLSHNDNNNFIPECEVILEGGEQTLEKTYKDCAKNPGHPTFIPVNEFTREHLPQELKTRENIMDLIQNRIDQTVRVRVAYTSMHRPDFFSDINVPYPYAQWKGNRRRVRYGTGSINRLLTPEPITDKPCPCLQCKTTGQPPKKMHCLLTIRTSTHVIFDNSEAEKSSFDCFYDSGGLEGKYKLYGLQLDDNNTTQDTRYQNDLCEVVCVVHDSETIDKLLDKAFTSNLPNGIPGMVTTTKPPAGVIVSHPHGCSKTITFGKTMHLTVPVKPNYKTNKLFHLPSGTKCQPPNTTVLEKLRKIISERKQTPAISKHNLGPEDGFLSKVVNVEAEFSSINRYSWVNSINNGLNKHRTNNRTDECIQCDLDFGSYTSGGIRTGTKNKKKGETSPEEEENLSDATWKAPIPSIGVFQLLAHPRVKDDVTDEDIASIASQFENISAEFCEASGLSSDFLEGLRSNFTESSLTNGGGSRVFGDIERVGEFIVPAVDEHELHKFRHDLQSGIVKPLQDPIELDQNPCEMGTELSQGMINGFLDNFVKRLIPPTPTTTFDNTEMIELPDEMTFTLSPEANYAMRYYNNYKGRPGWFQFPPGTKFTSKEGDEISLPDGTEFRNPLFVPEHVFMSYDIDTCPGSSGATVYTDLLQHESVTHFTHSGSVGGGINKSGVHENVTLPLMATLLPEAAASLASVLKLNP